LSKQEGFGSSYEKARSAIAAMKQHFPDRRLIVVFEPHTFSWRNRDALACTTTCLAAPRRC
jgi:UDP-N-acetylmuramate: L-alanyl-gamma-D-glutamyl-meso-diaminopimelate ligase